MACLIAGANPATASAKVLAPSTSPLSGSTPPGVITCVAAVKIGSRDGSSDPSTFTGTSLRIVPAFKSV